MFTYGLGHLFYKDFVSITAFTGMLYISNFPSNNSYHLGFFQCTLNGINELQEIYQTILVFPKV